MMRYIKFFEEFKGKRVTVKSEDKKKLREITRVIIKYCKEGKLTKNINDKYTIDFDLGELKNLLTAEYLYNKDYAKRNPNILDYNNKLHKDNGYKLVDDYAKKLSKLRGVDIIFDRKNGYFITASGKAMTTVNVVSEYPKENNMTDNTAGFQNSDNQRVFIDYKTGDIINNVRKDLERLRKGNYMPIWDFTGDNIYMSINRDIRSARKTNDGKTLLADIFSTLYHEFIHSNDPLCWNRNYLGNTEIYGKKNKGGIYASHDVEVQTFSNQFLELIEYYFERTLRGDTDGNVVNYDLPKEHINSVFIPVIMEIVKFINGESDKLSDFAILELSGTNKDKDSAWSVSQHLVNMRNEDAEDGKVIRQWLRDDFNRFVDYYNLKVIEINKKKEKGQELPLLHKGFPFELTPVKPTPENVDEVTDEIEDTKPGIKPVKKKGTTGNKPSDNSKLKFVSNPPKLPSWVKNPVVWASDEMEKILDKNLSVLATAYSKCFSNANPNVIVDVKKRLETLLKDLKTNNPIRIKDSVRVFYSNISPKLSDTNVSSWLKSPEGIKWGETIVKYENLVSHILK